MGLPDNFKPPINSIYIVEMGGVPLFARKYNLEGSQTVHDESDSVLLSGFLAAVEMFSRTSLKGKLHDIGFDEERYFFSKNKLDERHLIVVSAPTFGRANFIDNHQVKIIQHILDQTNSAFSMILTTAESMSLELEELMKGFETTVDSIIIETPFYFSEDDDELDMSYEEHTAAITSNASSIESLETTLFSKVRNFFKI